MIIINQFKPLHKLCFLLLIHTSLSLASDVKITNATYRDIALDSEQPKVLATFTVTWDNSWKNKKNHDAIWLFFKVSNKNDRSQRHARIIDKSWRMIHNYLPNSTSPEIKIPADRMGIFISSQDSHRGAISYRIQLTLDLSSVSGINLEEQLFVNPQAIEMVYIPEGSFYLGDSNPETQKNTAAFFEYASRKHFMIVSEGPIEVGANEGHLYYYNNNDTLFRGDVQGPIPATFPKGYRAFYVMKYELTEGEYAEFLNSIGSYYSSNRANYGAKDYYSRRGGIYQEGGIYKTEHKSRPCNFISFADAAAFTDWAALRPITELEYEKACRGTELPVENDFPWGTSSDERRSRYFNENGHLVYEEPLKEADLTDHSKDLYGASYYWVMDLNKSLWERCVTVGNVRGRNFKGSHGDGILGGYHGNATNEDWPDGLTGSSGLSYRGGGTYEYGMVGSPTGEVAHRPFGAWGDGPRTIAYGYRAGRTVD